MIVEAGGTAFPQSSRRSGRRSGPKLTTLFDAFESPDAHVLYFSKFDRAGIWSMPVGAGTESLVVGDRPQVGFWGHWAVIEAGIYFLDFKAEP